MSDAALPNNLGVPTGRDTADQAANESHAPLPKRRKKVSKGDKTDNDGISPSAVSPSSLVVDQYEDKPATLAQGFGFRGGGLTRLLMGGLAGVTTYDGWAQDEATVAVYMHLPSISSDTFAGPLTSQGNSIPVGRCLFIIFSQL